MSQSIARSRRLGARAVGRGLGLRRSVWLAAAAGACVGLAAVGSGCGEGDEGASAPSLELVAADTASWEITTLATGELRAGQQVELRSQVERQTTITEIVPEGSRVKAGDVLVRLASEEIEREIDEDEIQLTEARLNLESAVSAYQIQLSDNESAKRKAELAVSLAELALQQWREGELVKQQQALTTAIETARRDLDRLERKVVKSKELFERKFLSFDELERDEIALLEARAKHETALLEQRVYNEYQRVMDEQQLVADVEEAKQELLRVEQTNQINLKDKESQRENRMAVLAQREERLAYWKKQLEGCTVTAPSDGLVVYGTTAQSNDFRSQSEGGLAIGRTVRANDLLIVLPDTSEMVAAVKVHESLAGRVRAGQRATVKVDAAGGEVLTGEVQSIGVLAETGGWRDPNRREYTVNIVLERPRQPERLKPSMRCEANLVLGEVDEVTTVPVQAVFSEGPVRYVYVPEGPRFVKRPVRLGRRSDMFAEITAGLSAGDRVLVRAPEASEVLNRPWAAAEMTNAGYELDEQGRPKTPAGPGGPGGAGRPGGARAQRGGAAGAGGAAAAGGAAGDAPAKADEAAPAVAAVAAKPDGAAAGAGAGAAARAVPAAVTPEAAKPAAQPAGR